MTGSSLLLLANGAAQATGEGEGAVVLLARLLLILPLLTACAFFAGTETALLSLTMAHREALGAQAQEGDATSARILWLLSDPRRLITTLILGNEVVNISLSSLMTGIVQRLVQAIAGLFPPHVAGSRAFAMTDEAVIAVGTTVLTVPLLIVFGELTPKTIALKLAPRWARAVSWLTLVLTYALWLPRTVISLVAGAAIFLLGGRAAAKESPVLREREFRTLVDLGSAEGEIAGTERRLIHNVFDFGDLTVGKVMTPVDKVFALPVEMPLARLVQAVSKERHSRIPLFRGRRDNVVGVLFAKDLVGHARGDLLGRSVKDLLHPPLFVPRRAKADRLFREFQRRKTHMALVVDEYGRLAGLVTMEDLLLTLFRDLQEPSERESRLDREGRSGTALTPVASVHSDHPAPSPAEVAMQEGLMDPGTATLLAATEQPADAASAEVDREGRSGSAVDDERASSGAANDHERGGG